MDEQRPNSSDKDPKWDVNNPMDSEVQDGKPKQEGVYQNKTMISPVAPISKSLATFSDV
jgi:hypothetical protein